MEEIHHIQSLIQYRQNELERVNEELIKNFGTYNAIVMTALGHYQEKLKEEIEYYDTLIPNIVSEK